MVTLVWVAVAGNVFVSSRVLVVCGSFVIMILSKFRHLTKKLTIKKDANL